MQSLLTRWADALLAWLGLTSALNNGWDRWVAFALVVLSVVLLDFLCRKVLVRGIRRIVMRTKATWDDELFSSAVLSRLCNIVSAIVLVIVLPVVFDEQSEARTIVTRLIQVYIVVTVFRFINACFMRPSISSRRVLRGRTNRSTDCARPGRESQR